MLNIKATKRIIFTLLGCGLNNIFLEFIVRLDPGCGPLVTFFQFAFIALYGFIFTSKFGRYQAKMPKKAYLILVTLFFVTSILNNWAFNFNIPVPLHMIFRSGSLVANMILGIIILKKHYTLDKYISVGMITFGIIICTIFSSRGKRNCVDCDLMSQVKEADTEHLFWWIIGILLLIAALILSARMGIYQEVIYKEHGKHPEEALYYTHLYALPGFLIYWSSIWEHAQIITNSEMYTVPFINFSLPILWGMLILNVITQYVCISSVYVLTTECSSLTVTLVITLRKFISLIFSIVYFKNPFTIYHWIGTILVFSGTLIFSEVPKRILEATSSKKKT